ncbi:MAG: 4-hydroxythreonine-4-phosphate dehydrogenase PdxA [Hyphomicrobiaceae bacterium]|nr:4-hydroxythreonine-4-phosphate dehydrogenase PdxA [Hyphomicrobiaceae bacterium]
MRISSTAEKVRAAGPPSETRAAPKTPLAVSMGDPAGIGLDIILAAWLQRGELALPAFVAFASVAALSERARLLGLDVPLHTISRVIEASAAVARGLPVIDTPAGAPVTPGRPQPATAPATLAAIDAAVAAVARGEARAVVTAPIAKSVLYAAGFGHPGHTEYLGALSRRHWPDQPASPVMMLASDDLRVVPVTIHVPLSAVPALLTADAIETTIRITAAELQKRFSIARPRIAVAGLNPHAGESGTMGSEEIEIIAPAIARLCADGLDVRGPLPADTMFHAAARSRYDVAIAMYHDQGLVPLKTLAFDRAVNVTLGLPFVRTSPDHGTAFDIAGTGRADPASFIAALRMADRMSVDGVSSAVSAVPPAHHG